MNSKEVATRRALIEALSEAAEIEHALTCQYLYAAFSLRREPGEGLTWPQAETVRGWRTDLSLIARQEMEHLGLVTNLLTAIGGAPHFRLPPFPVPPAYFPVHVPLELRPLDRVALTRFLCLERPDDVHVEGCKSPLPRDAGRGEGPAFLTLQDLYGAIERGFEALVARRGAKRVFVGPPAAQISDTQFGWSKGGHYDVRMPAVTDLASAKAAIEQIVKEGEGAPHHREGSHYARLERIESELHRESASDPAFAPALDVVASPRAFPPASGWEGGTLITHPVTREVARLFDACYEAMLLMLARYYAQTDEPKRDAAALQQIAFFPMMTMAIRPLGEILTEMPAFRGREDGPRAGAPFELGRLTPFLPHKKAAWLVLHETLEEVAEDASRLAKANAGSGAPWAERLGFVSESLARLAWKFESTVIEHEKKEG